jgi:hypothetical protein
MLECPGCVQGLLYPAQHTTSCPAYTGHALIEIASSFIECECGKVTSRYERQDHIDDVKRQAAS